MRTIEEIKLTHPNEYVYPRCHCKKYLTDEIFALVKKDPEQYLYCSKCQRQLDAMNAMLDEDRAFEDDSY
jgi:hypothetical protein